MNALHENYRVDSMLEVVLDIWNIMLDGLDILWNMVFRLFDRQIAILLVVGTFALAVVAAFQDRIRSRLFASRLRLDGGPEYLPDIDPIPLGDPEGNIYGCFVGLPITNHGPAPAKDVEVLVSELERYHNNVFESDSRFYPLLLYWRHYVPKTVFLDRLLLHSIRHVGLGHIPSELTKESVGSGFEQLGIQQNKLPFVINSPMRPNTRSDIILPGRYRLTLEIAAANSQRPVKAVIELSFDGEWQADNTRGMVTIKRVHNS